MRSKRLFSQIAVASAVALILAGCSSNNGASDSALPKVDMMKTLGTGEGEVNVVAWGGYVENGSNDPAVDWVSDFEKSTGCKVNVKVGATSDEMVTLMKTGDYDVVSASGDASLRLIYGGDVAPVNTDLIPNYADIFKGLKNQQWNSVEGVAYGVPHGRGANLLAYRTDIVKPAPTSWGAVFDAASPYAGKITAYDSPIYIADAALYLMKTQPDLGITYPYALDQKQFDAAIALLNIQKPLIGEYWGDYLKHVASLKSGGTVLGTTWQVNINLAKSEGVPVEGIKPVEGSTGWSDTWMISSKAKHPNCGYMWMDHIASPKANAGVAEWFGEAPSNAKACDLTSDKNFCETFHAADDAYWTDVYYWNTPTEACLDGRADATCVPYSEWVKAWSSLRNA
ncbi:MAG: ABC transporter substrate-binding protein [Actinobacteria bacterium]|nr:ABC transporter substrate-binding protein [Actinomycetota bacterium]